MRTLLLKMIVCGAVFSSVCFGQIDAITKARYDLKLGFTVDGDVLKVYCKPGDRVKKGDLLMELNDEEGRYFVELYKIRASSDLELRTAQAAYELSRVEEKATIRAFEADAAKPIEVERAKIRTRQTEIDIRKAKQLGQENLQQLNQARERHAKYQLRAPTDGMIDRIAVKEGELVENIKPVLQLVVIDPLWIDAPVPTDQTLGLKQGHHAWVTPQLPGYDQAIKGKIIHMAQVADAASDTRLVRVEIENPDLMPAGGQVTVRFNGPTNAASVEAR